MAQNRKIREPVGKSRGLELVRLPYSEDCRAFGRPLATKFNMISIAMGDAKTGNGETSGAEYLTSTDPRCLMQIECVLRGRKSALPIQLAGILAQTTQVSDGTARRAANCGVSR